MNNDNCEKCGRNKGIYYNSHLTRVLFDNLTSQMKRKSIIETMKKQEEYCICDMIFPIVEIPKYLLK